MFRRLGTFSRFWQPAALVLAAVVTGSLTVLLKSCGSGGSGNPAGVELPTRDPAAGSAAAILGLVVDPFGQLCGPGSTAALCTGGPVFSAGNSVQLVGLSSRGEILFPPWPLPPWIATCALRFPFLARSRSRRGNWFRCNRTSLGRDGRPASLHRCGDLFSVQPSMSLLGARLSIASCCGNGSGYPSRT